MTDRPTTPRSPSAIEQAVFLIGALIAVLWLVEIADSFVLDDRLQRNGIRPRTIGGLDGVVWAPFLHGGFGHLIANTVPLVVLSAAMMLHGLRTWVVSTVGIVVLGGAATWLLARDAIHIGASGVIFGYVGFLFGLAYFQRSLRSIAIAVVVGLVYGGGLLVGFLPRPGISWEGHVFGFAAGIAMAALLGRKREDAATS